MSGHSKWSTIKRQKGKSDAKRGQEFTKLSNAITLAVKQGGGVSDPNGNFKLRLAVDRARAANMPKDNIDRAILRASGASAADVNEYLYEGFGPGGVAVIIEVVTDNKQRTISTLKNIFDKSGGVIGTSGSVSYLFERRGEIVAKRNNLSSDELLSFGIDAGVDDMEEAEDQVLYTVASDKLFEAKKRLEEQGVQVESAELVYNPMSPAPVAADVRMRIEDLLEKLEELEDVQQVYTNLEL